MAHNTGLSFVMRARRKARRECGDEIPPQRAALDTDANRQMVQLHLEGLSYREIGEVTGVSETAIGA